MSEREKHDSAIDRLVRQALESHEERVDVDAFLAGLRARREARRGKVRVLWRRVLLAAAATLLVVVGGLLVFSRAHRREPKTGELHAEMQRLKDSARAEVRDAWGGLHSVGVAAVSAGREPLLQLADATPSVPDVAGQPELWLDRALDGAGVVLDKANHPFVPTHPEDES
ncbi:MAG: hypothetical protein QGH74_02170 [Candidatus Brocadiia bacterium]|jgi:hypothetical protein|nr:hypothetical protein [Candidatus Brocadiia bacterium]